MEIEFLILCDSVQAVNGKLYMLGGGWDRWTSKSYPSPVQFGIAVGMIVPWDETNQRHRISILVQDEDAKQVVPAIAGEVEVGRPPGLREGVSQRALLAINAGIPLPHPGRYVIIATAPDGAEKRVVFDAVVAGQASVRF